MIDLLRCPTLTLAIARMTPEERELCAKEIDAEGDREMGESFNLAATIAGECWTGRGAAQKIRLFAGVTEALRQTIENDPEFKTLFLEALKRRA